MNEVQGFLLEDSGIRGALVRLEETWRQVIAEHNYTPQVRALLGEGVAATVLLASGLKVKPSVSLQLQGEGPLKLMVIQCTDGLRVRGMAHYSSAPPALPLLGHGKLVVNLDTGRPNGLFQGIVPMTSSKLDGCLEAYFKQSEQLPTRLILKSSDRQVAGLLIQVLPGHREDDASAIFNDVAACADTVSTAELTELAADRLLPKLFAGHAIRLFSPKAVAHDCRCTPERLAGVVRMLGEDECKSLLAEQGQVELTCEFCNRTFRYDDGEVQAMLRGAARSSLLH
ncbi:MAG TPA: Hsp33 family molecular chaperone HslO [Gammaproteobacteria bacterium]|nr:Hsp33 family molecular chaperone HslO [Gammaproteobacteria bacterium]